MGQMERITQRSAYAAQALATMGIDAEWDKRLTAYLTTECLAFSDLEFGALADSNERFTSARAATEVEFGKHFMQHEAARARLGEAKREADLVDEASTTQYLRPHWAAAKDLMATPAPTLAAALFKSNMIAWEDLFCEPGIGALAMGVVAADFHRLSAMGNA